jgi:hypothetical protein
MCYQEKRYNRKTILEIVCGNNAMKKNIFY